jgi:hypothetical protein
MKRLAIRAHLAGIALSQTEEEEIAKAVYGREPAGDRLPVRVLLGEEGGHERHGTDQY